MTIGDTIIYMCIITFWVLGTAVAQGFWSIVGCIFFPPYAWVLFATYILEH